MVSTEEVARMFECFGLENQELRDKIVSQGHVKIYDKPTELEYTTWVSNGTKNDNGETSTNA